MPPKHQHKGKGKKHDTSQHPSSSGGTSSTGRAHLATKMTPIQSASTSAGNADSSFTLATWNVLADAHVYPHYYPQCSKKQLGWNERFSLLLQRITELKPDILCLQEVDHWQDWDGSLKSQGYTNTYLARGGNKADGCAISVRRERFEIIDRLEIRFDDIAIMPFKDTQRISKHCVALGLVLRPVGVLGADDGSLDFLVVTTHLFWNPKFEDVKIRQAIYLCYKITQFWAYPQRLILCGDINSTPDSAIATYLRTGRTDLRSWPIKSISGRGYRGSCDGYSVFGIGAGKPADTFDIEPLNHSTNLNSEQLFELLSCPLLTHNLQLGSVYQGRLDLPDQVQPSSSNASNPNAELATKHKESPIEPITSHFQQFSGTLDYIFTSPNFRLQSLLRLPTDSEMKAVGFLPTTNFASDHLLLMTELQLIHKQQ